MNTLREIKVASELQLLLNRFAEIGGVIDYIVMHKDESEIISDALHQGAAILFMRIIKDRTENYFAELALSHPQYVSQNVFQIDIEPDRAIGRQISLDEFIGPCFDLQTKRLLLRGRTSNHLNDYFYVGDEEKNSNVVTIKNHYEGYAYAFSEPPYSLRASKQDINELFIAINQALFDGFEPQLEIYEWSNDWSTYFDAGNEWWGAFLWTVWNEKHNWIVGIGASATD